jgi:hypothetical protein
MKEIILTENCFGPDVIIDGQTVFDYMFDNRDPKEVEKIHKDIVSKLFDLRDKMTTGDWYKIVKMIIDKSNDYKYNTDQSEEMVLCPDCMSKNHKYVYINKNYDKES